MKQRKGIILAGGSSTRLHPVTIGISKQLMPVYDKPMIYYPLSTLMLAGIRDILIISTPNDLPKFQELLGDGTQIGITLSYTEEKKPEGLAQAFQLAANFLGESPAALILGDNLFYANELIRTLDRANVRQTGATIFSYHVSNPCDYGVVEYDQNGKVISIEEKPNKPKSNYAIPGLYFYDHTVVEKSYKLTPSARGELEITDLNRLYLGEGTLYVEELGRGTAWLDTGTHESLLDASNFVCTIQKRQNQMISCIEEIAYRKNWIDAKQLLENAESLKNSQYGQYLKALAHSNETDPSTPFALEEQ